MYPFLRNRIAIHLCVPVITFLVGGSWTVHAQTSIPCDCNFQDASSSEYHTCTVQMELVPVKRLESKIIDFRIHTTTDSEQCLTVQYELDEYKDLPFGLSGWYSYKVLVNVRDGSNIKRLAGEVYKSKPTIIAKSCQICNYGPFEESEEINGPKVSPAYLLDEGTLAYPRRVAAAEVCGQVDLSFIVAADGTTSNISVDWSTNKVFEGPAIDAVASSRYKPKTVDEKPVEVTHKRTIKFEFQTKPGCA